MRAGTLVPATREPFHEFGVVVGEALNEGRNFSSGNTTPFIGAPIEPPYAQ